jgi:hypothetical protein
VPKSPRISLEAGGNWSQLRQRRVTKVPAQTILSPVLPALLSRRRSPVRIRLGVLSELPAFPGDSEVQQRHRRRGRRAVWKGFGNKRVRRSAAADGRPVKLGGRHSLLYEVYVGSPLWRSHRWWWFVTSDRRCARCRRRVVLHGGGPATVTVHHRTYAGSGASAAAMSSCCAGAAIAAWIGGGIAGRRREDQAAWMPRRDVPDDGERDSPVRRRGAVGMR